MPVVPTTTEKHLWEAAANNQPRDRDSVLRKSGSLGALEGRSVARRTPAAGNSKAGAGSGGDRSQAKRGSGSAGDGPLEGYKSSTAVRFHGQAGGSDAWAEQDGEAGDVRGEAAATVTAPPVIQAGAACDAKVAGNMRRGSEMATWAVSGTSEKSARDYLW